MLHNSFERECIHLVDGHVEDMDGYTYHGIELVHFTQGAQTPILQWLVKQSALSLLSF